MSAKAPDLTGDVFGRLTVIGEVEPYISPKGNKSRRWLCKCECGNLTTVTMQHLKTGHTQSCGCYSQENRIRSGKLTKHGLTYKGGKVTRIYRIWSQIKTRCYNPHDEHYKDYGERGICVCDEWREDFESFHHWAVNNGYSNGLTIDRIDVNGNYEPSNCRWATSKEQSANKRNTVLVTYNGETKTLKEWSEITGINYQTLFWRYKNGRPLEEIFKKGNLKWN